MLIDCHKQYNRITNTHYCIPAESDKSVAEILKPDVEERMNIQMTPWIESDVVKMEELYTRLLVEKHENKPYGVHREEISGSDETSTEYMKLFEEDTKETKRILVKGDPGIGKTTFMRKVAWDWAKGYCKSFILVFIIVLKIVKPGDLLENIIIDQNPSLEAENINSQRIRNILTNHAEKCLILLDGFDEMPEGVSAIKRLIEKREFSKCNFILSSRPNSSHVVQKYFRTVTSIEGFTKERAREYIGKILIDKDKRDAVMKYSETNEIEDMWRYPVLIMFLCILVNDGELDVHTERLSLNALYSRLYNCLYKRYTVRNAVEFNPCERDETLLKLGKIAFEGIRNNKAGFQKKYVMEEVGKEAFDYGILIGSQDKRLVRQDDEDILIFFPHKHIWGHQIPGSIIWIVLIWSCTGICLSGTGICFTFCKQKYRSELLNYVIFGEVRYWILCVTSL